MNSQVLYRQFTAASRLERWTSHSLGQEKPDQVFWKHFATYSIFLLIVPLKKYRDLCLSLTHFFVFVTNC